jgi:hypothetical protein
MRAIYVGGYTHGATIAATRRFIETNMPGVRPNDGPGYGNQAGIQLEIEVGDHMTEETADMLLMGIRSFAEGYERGMADQSAYYENRG